MKSDLTYYVYAYLRKDTLTPYYIGKGKGNRAYSAHRIAVPQDKNRIIIIEKNLTDLGACAIERQLIRWYGRKDLGTGILHNLTNGGDGTSGYSHTDDHKEYMSKKLKGIVKSEETRKKLSLANKGKPGTPHTEEHKQYMSNLFKGVKKTYSSFAGKKHTEKTKKHLSENHYTKDPNWDSNTHNSKRPDIKLQKSIKQLGIPKPTFTCECCGSLIGGKSNYMRWHGNNCKKGESKLLAN